MSPLKVIVIGGGFAGMVCARVLREHHDVTILERVPHPHMHGSGVNLGPTAIRILTSLGFSRERAKSTVIERFRRFDRLGGVFQDDDMHPIAEKVGAPWYTQLWVDGWNELMRLATAPSDELGISGKQPTFIWGAKVVDADIEKGEVLVADGRKFQGDLIIGADGVNSAIRRLVVDQEHLARAWPTGTSAFRLTIMASEVNAAIGKTRIMDPDRPPSVDLYLAGDGSRRGIIMYPCRQYEVLNINCIAPDSMVRWPAEASPNMPADLKNLTEIFSDFGFTCKSLLGYE
ncbi:hypothetical protein MAP00_007589 [Monascus purpureus]|nr:hypothetical protein MAP00_007589 [Monascus purpureus]